MRILFIRSSHNLDFFLSALAKDSGHDEDMAEMIAYEIETLSSQLKELEEKFKVFILLSSK